MPKGKWTGKKDLINKASSRFLLCLIIHKITNPAFRNGTSGINPIISSQKINLLSLVFSKKSAMLQHGVPRRVCVLNSAL